MNATYHGGLAPKTDQIANSPPKIIFCPHQITRFGFIVPFPFPQEGIPSAQIWAGENNVCRSTQEMRDPLSGLIATIHHGDLLTREPEIVLVSLVGLTRTLVCQTLSNG